MPQANPGRFDGKKEKKSGLRTQFFAWRSQGENLMCGKTNRPLPKFNNVPLATHDTFPNPHTTLFSIESVIKKDDELRPR